MESIGKKKLSQPTRCAPTHAQGFRIAVPGVMLQAITVQTAAAPDRLAAALNSRHIPKLDALRFVSALLVMLYHFDYPIPAGFGVVCFFVMSGFLITWLLLQEREQTGNTSLKGFYLRRAFRIFPAFYAYWTMAVLIRLVRHHPVLWGQALAAFFYVSNYYQGLHAYPESMLSQSWSLGVEEQFYLLWPFLFAKLSGDRPKLLKLLGGIICGIWILRLVLYFVGVPEVYLYTAFECRADAIFVGCAMAIALRERRLDRLVAALCAHWTRLIPTYILLVASLWMHHRYGFRYRDPVGDIADPLLFAVLIVQLIGVEWRPLRVLDTRPVRYLGLISYSTYLYHGVVPVPAFLPVFLKVVPSYLMAAASYTWVEKPFLRMRDRVVKSLLASSECTQAMRVSEIIEQK
jgi:peptidoglycan/LPS O-acetylase OafA/YrhL